MTALRTLFSASPRWVALALALGTTGCTRDEDLARAVSNDGVTAPQTAVGTLAREMEALHGIVGVRLVLYLTIVVALTIVLRRAVHWITRLAWRLGLDRTRGLGVVASLSSVAVSGVAVVALVRPFFAVAPLATLIGVGVGGMIFALGAPDSLQSMFMGVQLAFRQRFREGEQIAVGDVRGTVRQIGLLETRIRTADGSTVQLPNRILARESLVISRAQHATLIELRTKLEGDAEPELVRRVHGVVTMSPYRREGTEVVVQTDRGSRELHVRVQTWATREPELVRECLSRVVVDAVRAYEEAPA